MKSKFVKWGEPAPFEAYLLVKEQDIPGYIAFQVLDLLDIDMQGNIRTIDKRTVGETLVAYVVTNRWGKSMIVGGKA